VNIDARLERIAKPGTICLDESGQTGREGFRLNLPELKFFHSTSADKNLMVFLHQEWG
jgi:hypothetical protein